MASEKTTIPNIGRRIERIRELKGIKQEALASILGVSQQTVSRIEKSKTIDNEKLEKVAKTLGVTANAIKNFDEDATIMNIQHNYEGSHNQGANLNYQCH